MGGIASGGFLGKLGRGFGKFDIAGKTLFGTSDPLNLFKRDPKGEFEPKTGEKRPESLKKKPNTAVRRAAQTNFSRNPETSDRRATLG